MRLCYVLLSPTFGMHQYTADYANRMAAEGHEVHLVTTSTYPADRYAPAVTIHTPVTTHDTGFNLSAIRHLPFAIRHLPFAIRRITALLQDLQPDVAHFTGPHLWNPLLLRRLRRRGVPTLHTLHDLDPHSGAVYGRLLYVWNRAILTGADHILVHGQCYRQRLLRQGYSPDHVTYTPLLHLFTGYASSPASSIQHPASSTPQALFFGRFERYKGLSALLQAWAQVAPARPEAGLLLAGAGDLAKVWPDELPPRVEVRNRLILDDEAQELFQRCAVVVLPYLDATQSALIAAAYSFGKPVIVTRVGALPEYVAPGETGWIVAPDSPQALTQALTAALSDPARLQRFGQAGKRWYNEQRSQEKDTLLQLYTTMKGTLRG